MLSGIALSVLFLLGSTVPSAVHPDEQVIGAEEGGRGKQDEHVKLAEAQEADFRDREEPSAIRKVSAEMHLPEQDVVLLVSWEDSLRLSTRSLWAHDPEGDADAKRLGRVIVRLRRELDRREKRLLGKMYYEFSKKLAREMNRRRWMQAGKVVPPQGEYIPAD